jgi:hypothetical protein
MTNSYNHKNKQRKSLDDSVFSKNHTRNVRYRVRIQEEVEAEREIDSFIKRQDNEEQHGTVEVHRPYP